MPTVSGASGGRTHAGHRQSRPAAVARLRPSSDASEQGKSVAGVRARDIARARGDTVPHVAGGIVGLGSCDGARVRGMP